MVGKRFFYITIGLASTGIGVVGVWLPGLPTVPFILIALWAFSGSSPRLHGWLVTIPLLQPAIQEIERYKKHSTIRLKTKLIAQGFAWTSFLLTLLSINHTGYIIAALVGLAAISCTLFMSITPTAVESAS